MSLHFVKTKNNIPDMSKREWTTIKEYEDIRFEFFEGIAKITIDRQEVIMLSVRKPISKCWMP